MSEENEDTQTYISSDIRCPTGSKGLMAKLVHLDTGREIDTSLNQGLDTVLVELSCRDCTKDFRRIIGDVLRVVHLYRVDGEFQFTKIQFRDDKSDKKIDRQTQIDIYALASSFRRPKN